jgi:hypothetical protein
MPDNNSIKVRSRAERSGSGQRACTEMLWIAVAILAVLATALALVMVG